jgi:TRAP-type uncharacterized transport system substrate-binding protein
MWFLFVVAIFTGAVFAQEQPARQENGVTVYDYRTADEVGRRVEFFTDFDPSSTTFIYNEAGEATITSGSVNIEGLIDKGLIQISAPTLGSTSMTIDIEGRNKKSSTWGIIFPKVFTAATTKDLVINVLEDIDAVRVAIKIATDGTDVVSVYGKFKRNIQGDR